MPTVSKRLYNYRRIKIMSRNLKIITINFFVYCVHFICKHCSAVCATHPSYTAVRHLPLHAGKSFCFVCSSHM